MKNREENEDRGFSSYGKALRTAGPLLTAGIQMAVAIGIMGGIGYLLDGKFGTTPWLMVTGIFLGAAAGMFQFVRTAINAGKDRSQDNT